MKKFTKLLCTLALLFGVVGGMTPVIAQQSELKIPIEILGMVVEDGQTGVIKAINPETLEELAENPEHIYAAKISFSGGTNNAFKYANMDVTDAVSQGCDRIVIEFGAAVGAGWNFHAYGGQSNYSSLEGETTHTLMLVGNSAIDDFSIFTLWAGTPKEITIKAMYFYRPEASDEPVELPTIDDNTTWTGSEPGAGNFMLYNVGTGQFLTAGNAWGTQASITTTGVSGATQVELIENGGNWFIRTGIGNANYGLENLAAAGDVYMDQSRNKQSTWTFTQVATGNGPVYNIISAANHGGGSGAYLTANDGNTVVSDNGTAASAYAQWKLLSASTAALLNLIDDYNAVKATIVAWTTSPNVTNAETATATFNTALEAADAKVAAATTAADINEAIADLKAAGNTFLENVIVVGGIDITNAWITNPAPYANGNGWTISGNATYDSGNRNAEFWNQSGASIKQTLPNLPKGAYRLTAIALTRTGRVATLSAGTASMSIATIDNGTVNSRGQANTWFNAGNGVNELDFTLDAPAASLEIGLTADNTTADYWMVWRSFSLTYYGDPLNLGKAALAEAVAAAAALEGTIPASVYASVAAVVTEQNQTYSTVDEYEAATAAIVEATNNAKILQASYSRYTTIKAAAKAIAADLDTTAPDAEMNAATTAAEIEAAIPTLRAAFLAELPNVTIPGAGYIDVTAVMVDNAGVHTNTDFWTIANLSNPGWNSSAGACAYGECEFYQRNFKFYQTLALTPGTWEFGVTGFHRAGNHNTNFYAGVDKILIPGVESSVVNNMADAKTYFDNGNGKVALKFLIEEAGDVEIGIDNQDDTQTDKWTIFRDFTLKYYGAPDYSIYAAQWEDAKDAAEAAKAAHSTITSGDEYTALNTAIADEPDDSWKKADYFAKIETLTDATSAFIAAATIFEAWPTAVAAANTAKTNNPNVTGTELTDLNAALADEPEANDKVSYEEKTVALTNATNVFTAAAPSYNQYVAYKAETVLLWGSALGVVDPTTAAEAAAGVHELNIAQYNKVATDYPFSLTSKIGDFSTWTGTAEVGTPRVAGTPNSLDWEHWSGVTHPYYEQDGNGYGNAGGWTIQYTKTTTLPAGSYVVKVAARSSAGVTSTVTCTALPGVEISLPCAGNNTRGINTDGEASWDENDTFISTGGKNASVGGTGAGWQWRFLPFTLDEETEVTMTFYAEASSQYQWMSIGDGELLSTENVATAVAYTDNNAELEITDVDLANVTITRDIKAGYNTVVLPFDLTLGQVEAAFGTGTQVYAFSEESTDPKRAVIYFNKVNAGTISANVPVLLKATVESNEQVFEGVEVVAPTEDVKVEGTNFDFVGVYAPATVEALDYFIGNGAIYKSAGNTNIKAFRAYLDNKTPEITGNGASEVKMYIDGLETGINEINGEAAENAAIYNLAGQRVNKAQKGIYIVNGKKVLVK